MSEKLQPHGERLEPNIDLSKESKNNLDRIEEQAKNHEHDNSAEIEDLQHKAEQQAVSGKEISVAEKSEQNAHPGYVQKELKQIAYQRTLNRARSHLNAPQRVLSRVIHQPVVESISNIGAKTIARPSGILVGGLFSLIGSSIILYMAKRTGFSYNYLMFILLFALGYGVGLVVELVMKLFNKKSQH